MAKQRNRTDWQLDLRPVTLSTPRGTTAPEAANGNGSKNGAYRPAPGANLEVSPGVAKALTDLHANDSAVLAALTDIRGALDGIRTGMSELAARVGAVEAQLAAERAPATPARPSRPSRPRRDTSRALRDAGSLEQPVSPPSVSDQDPTQ
ncbi:MAG TPA: hypothetical protein VHD81_13025 [Mycobacteriales bacterium]|nr:hypothetical protein [Mycobacteriales bacterium]